MKLLVVVCCESRQFYQWINQSLALPQWQGKYFLSVGRNLGADPRSRTSHVPTLHTCTEQQNIRPENKQTRTHSWLCQLHTSTVCIHWVRLIDVAIHVVCQFEAEYRRFALKRNDPGGFLEFYRLLQTIHHIPSVDVLLGYADVHGDLLPINNDDNFHKAVTSANPLLRIIITKKGKVSDLSA